MNKEEIEKAKEILNKFINNEIQRDKLERDNRCGGWKIGDTYKHLELNPATETLLQYIDQLEQENNKQNKIIDEMADKIYEEGIIWDNKEQVKQYFEKKVEELDDKNT